MLRILLILLTLTFSTAIKAQNKKLSLIAGFGIPELAYVGAQYELASNYEIGLSFGNGLTEEPFYSVSLINDYYFGRSKKTEKNTWYFSGRINFTNAEKKYAHYQFISAVAGIGKAFNLGNKSKILFDVGYTFSEKIKNEKDELIGPVRFNDYSEPGSVNGISARLQFSYLLK